MKQSLIFATVLMMMLCACSEEEKRVAVVEPPIVHIETPYYGEYVKSDIDIVFTGSARLIGGGELNDIQWLSDVDGFIGQGKKITSALSAGEHKITLMASNKESIGTDSIVLNVYKQKARRKRVVVTHKQKIRRVQDQDGAILLVDAENKVITDTSTGLMWMQTPDVYLYPYADARTFVHNCRHAGYSDWRLPTMSELSDVSNIYTGRRAMMSKEFNNYEGKTWTSTKSDIKIEEKIFYETVRYTFRFSQRQVFYSEKTIIDATALARVRLVRSAI